MRDYNSIINFKWGSEAFGKRKRSELSDKWFFYKPNIGNLSPSPQAPFSAFCSVPYSGGYPTGYGRYNRSSAGSPSKFTRKKLIKGITHFAPSGTGDVKNFYNYFLIKPFKRKSVILEEEYFLDGYILQTKDCEISVKVANQVLKYSIKSARPITIYPGYAGLSNSKQRPRTYDCGITLNKDTIHILADYKTIKIYWVMKITNGKEAKLSENNNIKLEGSGVDFLLSYSLDSFSLAEEKLLMIDTEKVEGEWKDLLNVIDIKASPKVEKLFYTALYHTLKRPFIYGKKGRVYDFATLWDMYKTHLPLVFLFYPERGSEIVKGLLSLFSEEGYFHNAKLMQDNTVYGREIQSSCLVNILLSMAEMYGVPSQYSEILPKKLSDIRYQMNRGLPRKPELTHNLDIADAFYALKNCNPDSVAEKLEEKIKELLDVIFDEDGVLLKTEGACYYEGSNINYSFRVSASTEQRMTFTDKEKLEKSLDDFFGFEKKPCKYFNRVVVIPSRVTHYGNKARRFEGLNNEPDMETPYMYGLLGRNDKQNKVLSQIMDSQYHIDDGGLCGNDDTGGLSSWYVWNALGLFPVAGTNILRIGCPQIESAVLNLEAPFYIEVKRESEKAIYLSSVTLNGKEQEVFEITVDDVKNGGKLEITLK